MARTSAATYFVRVDTYWQDSPDYFVGPFATRADAQAAIDGIDTADNVWRADSLCGGDIRTAVRVYPEVLTATEAKRRGMRGDYSSKHNVINAMPTSGDDLFDMVNGLREAM